MKNTSELKFGNFNVGNNRHFAKKKENMLKGKLSTNGKYLLKKETCIIDTNQIQWNTKISNFMAAQ